MNAPARLLSGRSQVQLPPGTPVLINTFAQFLSNCNLPLSGFPKDFPICKFYQPTEENDPLIALDLVANFEQI